MDKIRTQWLFIIPLAILVISVLPVFTLAIKQKTSANIVAVPADGVMLSSSVSSTFSRSPYFVLVDLENNKRRAIKNPFSNQVHGAGLGIAHLLLDEKAGVVIAKNIGPEAYGSLNAWDVQIYVGRCSTVQDAIVRLQSNMLVRATRPNVKPHYGLKLQGAPIGPAEPCPMSGGAASPAPSPVPCPVPLPPK